MTTGCPEERELGHRPYSAVVPCDLIDFVENDVFRSDGVVVSVTCTDDAGDVEAPFVVDWLNPRRQVGLQNSGGSASYQAPICGPDGVVLVGADPGNDPGFELAYQFFYQELAESLEGQVVGSNPWECDTK